MNEVVKLRAHHIVNMIQLVTHEADLLYNHEIAREQGYEEDVIDKINWLYFEIFSNPDQLIEILPEQNHENDPICQSCITKKIEHQCEKPLPMGVVGHDRQLADQYGLEFGATILVEKLWGIKPIPIFAKE